MTITINGNGTITGISVGGLPDGIVDTDMLAASAVTPAKSTITSFPDYIDTWTLTADKDIAGLGYFDSDFSRNTNFPSLGSAMTKSSEVFTFPATGIWELYFQVQILDGAENRYCNLQIGKSTDSGSSFTHIASSAGGIYDTSGDVYDNPSVQTTVDVTNTSTVKVRFSIGNEDGAHCEGHATEWRTGVQFKRIGDT